MKKIVFRKLTFLLVIYLSLASLIFNVKSASAVSCGEEFLCKTRPECPSACSNYKTVKETPDNENDICTCIKAGTSGIYISGSDDKQYYIGSPIKFGTIGDIISSLLPYIFVIAGLILFGLLIVNGLKFLTSGGNPKATEGAKSGLTAALVGFIIIFISYWIIQLLQVVLGINILGG